MSTKNHFEVEKIKGLPSNRNTSNSVKVRAPGAKVKEREFVESAVTHELPKSGNRYPGWEEMDPEGRRVKAINVKFNEHELGLLHELAQLDDRSVQRVISRVLIPAAREALAKAKSSTH